MVNELGPQIQWIQSYVTDLEVGQKIFEAQAHSGVGGPGTAACSGDLLLGALAACAQLTCQLVATAMGMMKPPRIKTSWP